MSQARPSNPAHDGELVVLVDEHDAERGTMPKLEAHRPPGALHRAISLFAADASGRLLLQRRAPGKYHFPGLWSNTCCSHPRPGERVVDAGARRLREEMGIDAPCARVGSFVYAATDPASGLVERELDHVLLARTDADPSPDPAEADHWRWMTLQQLRADLAARPHEFTPWLPRALDTLLRSAALDAPPFTPDGRRTAGAPGSRLARPRSASPRRRPPPRA